MPMRIVLGSQAMQNTLTVLYERIAGFEGQRDLAASRHVPLGD